MNVVIPKYAVWMLNLWIACVFFFIAACIGGAAVGFATGSGGGEIDPTAKGILFLVAFVLTGAFCVWKWRVLFLHKKD